MPLIAGSGFERGGGADRPKVAIVNERFVERFGLGTDAVGKRITTGDGDEPLDMRDRRHRARRQVQRGQARIRRRSSSCRASRRRFSAR